jgi:predicted glycoside hydrolase/deacetylase ChbG (UPF0249 family)
LEKPFLKVAEHLAQQFEVRLRGPRGWNHGCVRHPIGEYTIGDWTLSGRPASSLVSEVLGLVAGRGQRVPKRIEIVTHPGIVDEELAHHSSVTTRREEELVELFKLRALLEKVGL